MMQPAALSLSIFTRLANSAWGFSQRYWRLVVVAMLALLHVAVVRGVADPWARAMLLAHLGLLLLWQPFVRAQQRISPTQGLVLVLGAFIVMVRLDWWLLAFWVVVLAGLVGGKVYQHAARWQRRSYLVVFVYLVALLAVVILPEIAPRREIAPEIRRYAEYGLPLLFVPIALFPAEQEPAEAAQIIDFFYSIFLMLVLVVVILGSFTIMTLARMNYIEALASTVTLVGGAVLLVALAWNPRTGFAGLNVFFSRYLFSIGLPMERWLHFLAELSQLETRPERFLSEAVAALARLPWISGLVWRADLAKQREETLRQASYLQAVHETGARMTHDIKNLLQSLNVLTSAAAREENRDSPELQALVRRQLPAIAQRLSETLDKLQRPQEVQEAYAVAKDWWEALARQYRGEGVEFAAGRLPAEARLPRSLFDNVADNLIRNALAKCAAEEGTTVRVALECGEGVTLRVCDSGSAVPAQMEPSLLRAPVSSPDGLGIGLYQAARLAESKGYRLTLEANRDGEVCFALTGPAI